MKSISEIDFIINQKNYLSIEIMGSVKYSCLVLTEYF